MMNNESETFVVAFFALSAVSLKKNNTKLDIEQLSFLRFNQFKMIPPVDTYHKF